VADACQTYLEAVVLVAAAAALMLLLLYPHLPLLLLLLLLQRLLPRSPARLPSPADPLQQPPLLLQQRQQQQQQRTLLLLTLLPLLQQHLLLPLQLAQPHPKILLLLPPEVYVHLGSQVQAMERAGEGEGLLRGVHVHMPLQQQHKHN
jgi:hypothetical protein